jgi:hypothetical protein
MLGTKQFIANKLAETSLSPLEEIAPLKFS